MPAELITLYEDLKQDGLRFTRPTKFIFFCGGAMSAAPKSAGSFRHYLLNERAIGARLKGEVVLAEEANQLYRDTSYSDLITFEEDIARIAGLVLLVAESAGSLAELGAFAAVDTIRNNLAVLIQTTHYDAESFVRYGPIQKLMNDNQARIGVYPWKVSKSGALVKASARSHVGRITKFINEMINTRPNQEILKNNTDIRPFIFILWVLHLSNAISITDLHRYLDLIYPIALKDLKNKLFCMSLARWVGNYTYENKTFWYSISGADPISKYSFNTGVISDTGRRKSEVTSAITRELKAPRHVREHVSNLKTPAP